MTYNVFGGTLNLALSIYLSAVRSRHFSVCPCTYVFVSVCQSLRRPPRTSRPGGGAQGGKTALSRSERSPMVMKGSYNVSVKKSINLYSPMQLQANKQ